MTGVPRAGASAMWRHVRTAPGTFIWLAILFVTTVIAHRVGHDQLTDILQNRSTNLRHLMHDPLPSLFRSAFWIDGNGWFVYVLPYVLIHATIERWLGTARWLAVVVIAHVGATYISQSVLLWAINTGHAPQSDLNVIDIGVSYGLAGVAGILVYRLHGPWRYGYLAALVVVAATPVVWPLLNGSHGTFTDIGHLCAVLIGLLCYPLTRVGRTTPLRVELPPVSAHIVERTFPDPDLPPVSPHLLERTLSGEAVSSPRDALGT